MEVEAAARATAVVVATEANRAVAMERANTVTMNAEMTIRMASNKAVGMEEVSRVPAVGDMINSKAVGMEEVNKVVGMEEVNKVVGTEEANKVVGMEEANKVDMGKEAEWEVRVMGMTATAQVEEVVAMALKIVLAEDMAVEGTSSKRVEDQVMALEATSIPIKLHSTPSNMAAETATCSHLRCRS